MAHHYSELNCLACNTIYLNVYPLLSLSRCWKHGSSLCCMWWKSSMLSSMFTIQEENCETENELRVCWIFIMFICVVIQILIARGASLTAENAKGYASNIFSSPICSIYIIIQWFASGISLHLAAMILFTSFQLGIKNPNS
jgi:hypothetical protein